MSRVFQIDGVDHRIIGRAGLLPLERGYIEQAYGWQNVLQRRFLWWWLDVETEEVPAFAWIGVATLGYTDWKSPLVARYPEALA